jgi:hypothetical protein
LKNNNFDKEIKLFEVIDGNISFMEKNGIFNNKASGKYQELKQLFDK